MSKKKYSVMFIVNCSTQLIVEADNEDEARDIAENEISEPNLCHHCGRDMNVDSVGEITEVLEL